jgi:hypothetical protein
MVQFRRAVLWCGTSLMSGTACLSAVRRRRGFPFVEWWSPPLNMPYHRLGAGNYLPHRENVYITANRNTNLNRRAMLATPMVQWFVLGSPGLNYRHSPCIRAGTWFLSFCSGQCRLLHQIWSLPFFLTCLPTHSLSVVLFYAAWSEILRASLNNPYIK